MSNLKQKGHELGLITDSGLFPDNSVQDCLNMDFSPFSDTKRSPYDLYLNINLPSGYNIVNFYEKKFTSFNNLTENVLIIFARNNSLGKSKFFVNKYFVGKTTDDNYQPLASSESWADELVELTETFTLTNANTVSINDGASSQTRVLEYNYSQNLPNINDYYKGFYLYNSDNKCVGYITKYEHGTNPNHHKFYIIKNRYVQDFETISSYSINTGVNYYLSRFPVNILNNTAWDNIINCNFSESNNNILIACGESSRTLILTFLSDKNYFNNIPSYNADDDYKLTHSYNGFWFDFQIPNIPQSKIVTDFVADDGGTSLPFGDFEVSWDGNTKTGNDTYSAYFNIPELNLIIACVIEYNLQSVKDEPNWIYGPDGDNNNKGFFDDLFSVVAELDGFQSIPLKMLMTRRFRIDNGGKNYYFNIQINLLSFEIPFDYNRRLSNFLHFYQRADLYFEGNDSKNYDPNLLPDKYNGTISVNSDIVTTTQNRIIFEYPHFEKGVVRPNYTTEKYLEPSNYNSDDEYNSPFCTNPENDRLNLNGYLNNYHYKSVHIKSNDFINVNELMIALQLDKSSTNFDTNLQTTGLNKICISQIQQGNVITDSIFPDERVRQVCPLGETIITGAHLYGNKFFIFSESSIYQYEIIDLNNATIALQNTYKKISCSKKNHFVNARFGNQFAGFYWIGIDNTIYRFLNDKPEDILLGRWKNQFQNINLSDIQNATSGFDAFNKDVYFLIGNKIYIWNLNYQNWRIYDFFHLPNKFFTSPDGLISFSNLNNIYKKLPPNSEFTQDNQSSDPVPFQFYLSKNVTLGDKTVRKIFDRTEIVFDKTVEIPNSNLPAEQFLFDEPNYSLITTTLQRFTPKYWHTNHDIESNAVVITTNTGFIFKGLVRRPNQFLGVKWTSNDVWGHKYLKYETNNDYTGCWLKFRVISDSNAINFSGANGLTLTVIKSDASPTQYVRLWNYRVLPNPNAPDNSEHDQTFLIKFDGTLLDGFSPTNPVSTNNIAELLFSCNHKDYSGSSTPFTSPTQRECQYEFRDIEVSNTNTTVKRITENFLPHNLKMTDGYDDSSVITPELLVDSIYQLGYRNAYVLYIGFSHFMNLIWNGSSFKIDSSGNALNNPTVAWITNLCKELHEKGMYLIISVSFELLADASYSPAVDWTPDNWKQKNHAGAVAQTGWNPKSTLLTPNNPDVITYLSNVAIEVLNIVHSFGMEKHYQIGEPWWWDNSFSDNSPCIYDTFTQALYVLEVGTVPTPLLTTTLSTPASQHIPYLEWLRSKLGVATTNLKNNILAEHPGTKCYLLFFTPQILGGNPVTSICNLPINEWKYPEFDIIQIEDYDWVTANYSFDELNPTWETAQELLEYPLSNIEYFAGYVNDPDEYEDQWGMIHQVIQDVFNLRLPLNQYVWARPQVFRDGYIWHLNNNSDLFLTIQGSSENSNDLKLVNIDYNINTNKYSKQINHQIASPRISLNHFTVKLLVKPDYSKFLKRFELFQFHINSKIVNRRLTNT